MLSTKLTSMLALIAMTLVDAFPLHSVEEVMKRAMSMHKRGLLDPRSFEFLSEFNKHGFAKRDVLGDVSSMLQGLDLPSAQPIGLAEIPDDAHPYIAPGPTDIRGLCPTLNTMANHNYISRTGVTTFAEAANGCQIAFGFSLDLCTFLSGLGLLAGGDILTGKMSISGPSAAVPNTTGENRGIDTHGPFEIDGSITRNDTYFGDNHTFMPDRFSEWVKQSEANGGLFNTATMSHNQAYSYNLSRSTNPVGQYGAKYFGVSYAERVFIPVALANGTMPDTPNYANIAPFFLEGRFPDNWFRRATPYTLMNTGTDIIAMYQAAPVEIGSNVNGAFVPEDISADMSSPQALVCFLVTSLFQAMPSSAAGTVAGQQTAYNTFVNMVFVPIFGAGSEFNCDLEVFASE